jgi:hypothetical protein
MMHGAAAKRLRFKPRQLMAWTILLSLAFYFGVVPAYRWLTAPPPLNVAAFNQVRVGMTMADVIGLLGGPPGDYGRYDGNAMMTLEGAFGPPGSVQVHWFDDDNRLEVWFDQSGTVVHVHRRAGFTRRPTTLADSLRRFLYQAKRALGL